MNELKACPFCGGRAIYYGDCDMVRVQCATCGANTSGWWDESEEAAQEWNRRAGQKGDGKDENRHRV